MSLTEPQIRRYARHILLPEVGGRGQERLLATRVRIRGETLLTDLACSYLEAAGVTCEVHEGGGLTLDISVSGDPVGDVSLAGGGADPARISVLANITREGSPLTAPVETAMVAASLAASEALRMILGLGSASHEWQVRGHQITSSPK